jgi:hypothetical protein
MGIAKRFHFALCTPITVITICSILSLGLPLQAQAGLTSGLVAYYPFNGNSKDMSGNGYNLTNNGAVLTADRFGDPNSAYYFRGVSSYLSIPFWSYSALYPKNGPFSISVWFKTAEANVSQNQVSVVAVWNDGNNGYGYNLYINGDSVAFYMDTASDGGVINTSASVIDGNWHHALATWDTSLGAVYIYVDGVLSGQGSAFGEFQFNPDFSILFTVGVGYGGAGAFTGDIDDIRVYSRALTPTEVQELYTGSFGLHTQFTAEKGTGTISVNAVLPEYYWKASSNSTWITISSGASGTKGAGQVVYQVDQNTGAGARSGQITIGDQTYLIKQEGAGN